MNCAHCQELLLDHLYDLLDGAEADAVEVHLAMCPACAAARAETARVQGLFARAAKAAFPRVAFEPPAKPAPAPQPAAPAARAEPARPGRGARVAAALSWAVAAAVLLAVPGTVVPVLGLYDRADRAGRTADLAAREADRIEGAVPGPAARAASLRDKLASAEAAQSALLNKLVEAQRRAVEAATARRLTVDVVKPATVQPGAPNDFLVVLRDGRDNWQALGNSMVAEVHAVDASDAVIFTQPIKHEGHADAHRVRLPASAWSKVRPNAELFLVLAQVDEKTQTRTELGDRVRLAGPVYATMLATDRAAYRPGERVLFRSLTLDRATFQPPARQQFLKYELLGPDGRALAGRTVAGTTELVRVLGDGRVEPVRAAGGQPVRGVACGELDLPPDLPDGDYALRLTELAHPAGYAPAVPVPVVRPLKVRRAPADVARKEIGFAAASYRPGDTVEAWAELKLADKPVAGAVLESVLVEADGTPVAGATFERLTDAAGRARLGFPLPPEVPDGDVRVKVTFRTPAGPESVAARVPTVANRVKVEFFPEGGDTLIAGVPCKVYVRATTPAGRPVEFRGTVTDGRRVLAEVASLNDADRPGANRGLAAFTYTPELGTHVWLKLEAPAHVYAPVLAGVPVAAAQVAALGGAGATAARTGFALPEPRPDGVALSVLDPVTAPGTPIRVRLQSVARARELVVGAYTRGRLSDTQKVSLEPDVPQVVELMVGSDPRGGVVRVTAFEDPGTNADLIAVAERLVFRRPGEVLNLALAAGAPGAAPVPLGGTAAPAFGAGAALDLHVAATDEKGRPAAAVLWAAAVNTGVAPGPRDRALPTHFLLAGEVESPDELEHADFLLTDHPRAAEALDLLLGTQGWRRFAEQKPVPGPKARTRDAELANLSLYTGRFQTRTEPQPLVDHRKVAEQFAPMLAAAAEKVNALRAALARGDAEPDDGATAAARERAREARTGAEARAAEAERARGAVRRFASGAWFAVGGLAALALACGAVAVARPANRLPCGVSTLGALGLAAFLVVAVGWADPVRAAGAAADAHLMSGARSRSGDSAEQSVLASGALAPGTKGATDNAPGSPTETTGLKNKMSPGKVSAAGAKPESKPDSAAGYGRPPFAPGGPGARPSQQFGGLPVLPGGPGSPPNEKPPAPPGLPGPTTMQLAAPAAPAALTPGGGTGWGPHRGSVRPSDLTGADGFHAAAGGSSPALRFDKSADGRVDADAVNRFVRDRAEQNRAVLDEFRQLYFTDQKPGDGEHERRKRFESFAEEQLRGVLVPPAPLVVREYAPPRPAPAALADATAPDTILWHPVIVLPTDGKAVIPFALGAAPGGYELLVAGHTADGRLGAERRVLRVAPGAPGASVPPVVPLAPGARPAP